MVVRKQRKGTGTFFIVSLWRDSLRQAKQRKVLSLSSSTLAQTSTNHYDVLGRAWKTVQPDGTSVTNEFHLTGELKKTYGSRTYPVEYTYDHAGRMKTMKTWQDFAGNAGAALTTWNYDSQRGWLNSKQYADGQGPGYTYTDAGRLETRGWARGITNSYAYDNAGQLSGMNYSDSTPDVTYTHDRRGRQIAVTSSSGNATLAYNDAGQLTGESHTSGPLNGLTVTNTYDALLRRASLALGGTSYASPTYYTYDAASRLATVSDGTNSATYSYLANSHLVSNIVFQQSSTTRMTTTKQYDNLGRLTSIASSSSSFSSSSSYLYNQANQRTAVTNADGSYWVYAYDVLGQVTSGKRYWADTTPVAGQQFEYGFDDIGNRKTTKVGGDAAGANLRQSSYSANALNQYVSRTVPPYVEVQGSAATNATVTVNNQPTYRKGEYFRKELAALNLDYPVWLGVTNVAVIQNAPNPDIVTTNQGRLFLGKTPEVFTHDADGNLKENAEWKLTWDGENRLTSMETTFNAAAAGKPRQKLEFAYDHQSRRIQTKVYDWISGAWSLTADLRFVYDGWNLIAVLTSNLTPLTSFMWGSDLSGSLQGAGGVGGLLAVSNHQSPIGTHFVANDGNGNVTALVDAADGTESARYEYSPFGETLRATGPMAFANPFRFSTKYQDDLTGFYYYGYRFFDPTIGRWASRDPIEEAGGANVFGFVANSSVNIIDVLGLQIFNFPPPIFYYIGGPSEIIALDKTFPDTQTRTYWANRWLACPRWIVHGKLKIIGPDNEQTVNVAPTRPSTYVGDSSVGYRTASGVWRAKRVTVVRPASISRSPQRFTPTSYSSAAHQGKMLAVRITFAWTVWDQLGRPLPGVHVRGDRSENQNDNTSFSYNDPFSSGGSGNTDASGQISDIYQGSFHGGGTRKWIHGFHIGNWEAWLPQKWDADSGNVGNDKGYFH